MVTTTETKEVTLNLSIQTNKNTWTSLGAAGALLIVGILFAVTLGIGWMGTEFGNAEVSYKLSKVEMMGQSSTYGEAGDGDADGVGMLTTAHVFAIIATVVAFVSFVALAASAFLQNRLLRIVAAGLAALTMLCAMLATVFAPVGISAFHGDMFEHAGGSLSWGAGLILAIIASVLAIGGAVSGFLALRKGSA